ncbi:MAG: heat-inducible transcription repressor HrcA [Bacilli bacterium]|nr:heat-inducible transcription repressor HrcA [Bacilli bacterium]
MLTNRQNEILKLIVLEYIKLAKPVGSNLICDRLKCSSATIRSEMAALEELGLLEKTHTSSGRVPSEEGYRYYVDNLMKLKEISAEDMLKLQLIFNNNQLELSDCLKRSLEIVSDITNYTSVVLGNKSHENTLKEVNIVPLSNSSMTVIVITDKGFVEHKTINVNGISLEEIKKTVNLINNLIIGTPIDEVSSKLEFEIKPIIGNYVKEHERLYNVFYNVFTNFTNRNVDVVGKNNILKLPEFSSVEKVRDIMDKLDDDNIEKIVEEDDLNNIKVYIGKESKLDDDMTVIKTKYKTDKEEGTIAIIGPKRMEYDRVVNLLEFIKNNIENK